MTIQSNVLMFRNARNFNSLCAVYELGSSEMEVRQEHIITFPKYFGKALAEKHIAAANLALSKQNTKGSGYFIDTADLGNVEDDVIRYVLFCDNSFYDEYLATSPMTIRAERFVFPESISNTEIKAFILQLTGEVNSYCRSNGLGNAMGFINNTKTFMDLEIAGEKSFVLVCNEEFYTGYQALTEEEIQPQSVGV